MCGIAGITGTPPNSQAVLAAINRLSRRGPDHSAHVSIDGMTLAHTRLSIIDLSDNAAQPMRSSCGRYIIVFNGEIYNYRELRESTSQYYEYRTNSDTETILALYSRYGAAAVEQLRGMFAFAIWDTVDHALFLARDRLGVKPLYYSATESYFAFASRPTALLTLLERANVHIHPDALRLYYELGYVPGELSIYEGVSKLQPGHCVLVRGRSVSVQQYWSLASIEVDERLRGSSERALVSRLGDLIDESVLLRMRSDVQVGAFLSGGFDSSIVVESMRRQSGSSFPCFTISFADRNYDEGERARAIARHLGVEHHVRRMGASDLLELRDSFFENFDEPFSDSSAFPVLAVSAFARDMGVKVVQSGDGGDEAFGGYPQYTYLRVTNMLSAAPRVVLGIAAMAARALGSADSSLARAVDAARLTTAPARFAYIRGHLKSRPQLLDHSFLARTRSAQRLFEIQASEFAPNIADEELAMRLDVKFTLGDGYLQKVDVATMASSLEARDPLLDHLLYEWAAALPIRWKTRGLQRKYLLRKLAYARMPRQLFTGRKMGFGVPISSWLRKDLRQWGARLVGSELVSKLYINRDVLSALWKAHQLGASDNGAVLWNALVMLQFAENNITLFGRTETVVAA